MLFFLVFASSIIAIWSRFAHACIATGTCGGIGPCLSPIPPVASPCMQTGCGAGFACGSYGCYRTRSRLHGTGTLKKGSPLLGNSIIEAEDSSSRSSFSGGRRMPQDPNTLFMQCCEQRGLPDACLQKCTFNTYTKTALTKMYFKQDACPLAATAEIQFCAAQGQDHTDCCKRNAVATTLAGDKCLIFCDQRPGNVTLLDYSYLSCYDRFDQMKACFWHDAVNYRK